MVLFLKVISRFFKWNGRTANNQSDIDLYIETKNEKLKEEIGAINSKLSVKIGKFKLSSFLIREIIKNHVIVKGVERFYEKSRIFDWIT